MRIRATKPEFWRSDRIAAVSWDARFVLKALESYVDDNGVGKDDLELIVGDLFMRDLIREGSLLLARVSEAISELETTGLVWRYSDEGTDLLYLSFWESVQRIDKPQSGRFRRPDGTLHYKESQIREAVATPREPSRALAPVTGEQGNRGTEEKTCASADAEREFDDWWEAYPRKRGKGQAIKAYRAARRTTSPKDLLAAIKQQRAALVAKGAEFAPYPATWLNGQRWLDEPDSNVRALRPEPDEQGRVALPPLPKPFFDQ